MINCNPETVSTDYDTSDRLYFEPLTAEDVLAVSRGRAARGRDRPVRRPDAAAAGRRRSRRPGVPLLGTPVDAIDLAEDRGRFGALLRRLEIAHPPYGTALSAEEAAVIAEDVGFPLLVRPSYVLGGRAMEICYSAEDLAAYLERQRARPTRSTRCCSTASSRTRSRSTSTRSPTASDVRRRRDHAARRGGRRPLRRLGLRDPADEPRRGDARGDPRDHAADRARARRDRPDQHPVRGRRRASST